MTWGCHNQDIVEMLNNDIMGYWMILLAGFIFGKKQLRMG